MKSTSARRLRDAPVALRLWLALGRSPWGLFFGKFCVSAPQMVERGLVGLLPVRAVWYSLWDNLFYITGYHTISTPKTGNAANPLFIRLAAYLLWCD